MNPFASGAGRGGCKYLQACHPALDYDIYVEVLDGSNPDLVGFHLSGPGGGSPRGIRMARIYGFAAMSARDYAGYMRAGRTEADAKRARCGMVAGVLPGAPGPAPGVARAGQAVPAAAAVQVPGGRVWVLCESRGNKKIGDQVVPLRTIQSWAISASCRWILMLGMEESACMIKVQLMRAGEASEGDDRLVADDIRTMSVKFTANGERRRGFRETVDEYTVTEMEGVPLSLGLVFPDFRQCGR